MANFMVRALCAALACYAFNDAAAAPAFRILYHEAIRPQTQQVSGHTRAMTFDAYGRRFNLQLRPDDAVRRAVPAGRTDIEALSGQLNGQAGSWVRITHTRSGWRGMISDGQELYAVEPAADVAAAVVQPLGALSGSEPVMYRLKDALLPLSPAFCAVVDAKGVPIAGTEPLPGGNAPGSDAPTAKTLFDVVVHDASSPPSLPASRVLVGVVADYEFYQQYSDDPEGTIISRMAIVDGIWSSQVGVKVSLAPLTVINTPNEPFIGTSPTDLLATVRTFRSTSSAQKATALTHLMTGRDLDGTIVGIAYLDSVCSGDGADSLSEGGHSMLMSALIAAHELGHNFNAPHDGVPGACATTPQTFLMAPAINFSNTFSDCSLTQIHARMRTAQCLTRYTPPDVAVEPLKSSVDSVPNSTFVLSFMARAVGDDVSSSVTATAALPANMSLQSASAEGGTCTSDNVSVTCALGDLTPEESRRIDLSMMGTVDGTYAATVAVSSPNDSVAANNTAQVSIRISSAAQPAVASASTSVGGASGTGASGGGGGGSMDAWLLALLFAVAGRAARQRLRGERPGFIASPIANGVHRRRL